MVTSHHQSFVWCRAQFPVTPPRQMVPPSERSMVLVSAKRTHTSYIMITSFVMNELVSHLKSQSRAVQSSCGSEGLCNRGYVSLQSWRCLWLGQGNHGSCQPSQFKTDQESQHKLIQDQVKGFFPSTYIDNAVIEHKGILGTRSRPPDC